MNQVKIKLWAEKKNSEYAVRKLCLSNLKYNTLVSELFFSILQNQNTTHHLYIDSKTNSLGEKKVKL